MPGAVRGADDRLARLEGDLAAVELEGGHSESSSENWQGERLERDQRSHSPPIMLSEPKVGTMSAIIGAGDDALEARRDQEARRADAHAVGRAAAVGDEVEAELAVAALGVRVAPRRRAP